jgi:CO/xanthine dehydrogenase FAD-binding subunit
MSVFDYQRPGSLGEANELLLRDHAVALAGGTDLLVAIRHRAVDPGLVVDLKSVEDIRDDIDVEEERLVIGGRVVMSRLVSDEMVNEKFPALASAGSVVGSIQIRNRATLAGNLCNASPAADTAPALLAYSAAVTIAGGQTSRTVPLDEFFLGPGSTILGRGEVVTSVELPIPTDQIGSAFARVTRRRGVDLATVSLACTVDGSGKARFGFGAVGPTPLVAESTVEELASDDGLESLLAVTSPISDVRAGADYRHAMLRVHTRRALESAMGQLRARS